MKIGVFDSGVGGLSVAKAIEDALPEHETMYVHDRANVPYGDKTPEQLFALVLPILERMQTQGCNVIVIACNTVTTTVISKLRERIQLPLVAIEPMVKPAAALTKTDTIAVCATPTTLASPRYNELKQTYAQNITVLEPDCSDWSAMIEADKVNRDTIEARISDVCGQGADVIVLGCTHYHWIQQEIEAIAQEYKAEVIQPEQAIITQLKRVLAQLS